MTYNCLIHNAEFGIGYTTKVLGICTGFQFEGGKRSEAKGHLTIAANNIYSLE